jgi:hypothetical protein
VTACAAMLKPIVLSGDMIPVRHTEGLEHGFLVLRTLEGKAIADGQMMMQDAHGDRVTMHLIFRFKDGSIYEETTSYSQRGTFRLLSDHRGSSRRTCTSGFSAAKLQPSSSQRAHSMPAALSGEYNLQPPESSRETQHTRPKVNLKPEPYPDLERSWAAALK